MEPIKILKGANGQVELYSQKIIIKRKGVLGFLTQGLKGEKVIPFNSITSIQVKKAGLLTRGYIQFGVLGGNESRGGLVSATKDENTVLFDKKVVEDVDFIKSYIDLNKSTGGSSQYSVSDEINKLKSLLDDGVITQTDFDLQKKKLFS